jgi:hypothetical protein
MRTTRLVMAAAAVIGVVAPFTLCANPVYAAAYNFFCATAPGGPYPVGPENPYENGTSLQNPVLKGH